jgi:DNA (cytosine-5)-methyltransferase 1
MITHGSLFSGGGGFDLAAQWMGYKNIFHCEWMPFPRYILDYHFPESDSHENIITTDFKKYANKIDILTGGFPCQPFSLAGKRKGTDDERYLWREMLRAVQEIKPKCVIAENVYGLTNIDGGLVFEQVCLDLENEGYEVQTFIIPACAKNAPHRRDRVWIVAYNYGIGRKFSRPEFNQRAIYFCQGYSICTNFTTIGKIWNATNPNSNGQHQRNCNNEIDASKTRFDAQRYIEQNAMYTYCTMSTRKHIGQQEQRKFNRPNSRAQFNYWQNFPTESPICGGDDGISSELDGTAFLESTGKKIRNFKSYHRAESIKLYGNAIVPQVAMELFKALELTTTI